MPDARLTMLDIPGPVLQLVESTRVSELTTQFHVCCTFVLQAVSAITSALSDVSPRRCGSEMLLQSALECVSRMAQRTPELLRTDIPGLVNQVLLPCILNGMLSGSVSSLAISTYASLCGPVPEVLGVLTSADLQANPSNPGQGLFGARILCSALEQIRRLTGAREADAARQLIACLNSESLPILDAAGTWKPQSSATPHADGNAPSNDVSAASGVAIAYSVFVYCGQILRALMAPAVLVPSSFQELNSYLECLLIVASFCLETYRQAEQDVPVPETREVLVLTFEFVKNYASYPDLDDALAVSTDMIVEVAYLPDCDNFKDVFTQYVGQILRPVGQILFDVSRSEIQNCYMTLLASLLPVMGQTDRGKALDSCRSLWANPATTALTRCSCLSFLHDLNALEPLDRSTLNYCLSCLRESQQIVRDGVRMDKAGRPYLDFQTAQLAKACVKLTLHVISNPNLDQSNFMFMETVGMTLNVISQVYDYEGSAAGFQPAEVFNETFMALAILLLMKCSDFRDIKNYLNGSLIFNFVKKSLRIMQVSNDPMVKSVFQNAYGTFQHMIMTK